MVVACFLLAHNINFFQIISTHFLARVFLNISLKRDLMLNLTSKLSTKSDFYTCWVRTSVAQSLSHCHKSAIVTTGIRTELPP